MINVIIFNILIIATLLICTDGMYTYELDTYLSMYTCTYD